jgi:hypothetical protein
MVARIIRGFRFWNEKETVMVSVAYDTVRVPTAGAPAQAEATAPRKRWYARLMDALIEARMEQARREVARYMHFMPYVLDERGNRIVRTGARNMPFGGW